MPLLLALIAVVVLAAVAWAGSAAGLGVLFTVGLPYAALALFLGGIVFKVLRWARAPVPFRIPTTCGQQKSLPWLGRQRLEAPANGWEAAVRVMGEVFLFRSLFRNTKFGFNSGRKMVQTSEKWLWLFALAFHWCLLLVFLRHLRIFLVSAPSFLHLVDAADGFFQLTVPTFYLSDAVILAALGFLLLRRLWDARLRYISLASDYFALLLLLGIAISGVWMRYITKVDMVAVKQWALGLVTFQPAPPPPAADEFYIHLFLVCVLAAYFPFSKLMHMGGVFLSPTRNMANNNRAHRHVNPWNPTAEQVHVHTYEEWENDFRDKLKAIGYRLEGE